MNPELCRYKFECLNPVQIKEALDNMPIMYIPMGTYEWHGNHLPVGNDAVKAHALCLLAAQQTGGLVMPPFYYGTAGHIGYPLTVLVREEPIMELMRATLDELVKWGVNVAVMFTGHFSGEQMDMVKRIAEAWDDPQMKVLNLTDYMLPNPLFFPDHAAIFETSMLNGISPELVHLENLPNIESSPANDPNGDTWGTHRHNPNHPLYGIFGDDPRKCENYSSAQLAAQTVDWLAKTVLTAYGDINEKH